MKIQAGAETLVGVFRSVRPVNTLVDLEMLVEIDLNAVIAPGR